MGELNLSDNKYKVVSIKAQNIISFIPIINCSSVFIWLYNYSKIPRDYKILFISVLKAFLYSLPYIIIQILASRFLYTYYVLKSIIDLLALYVIPLSISRGLIKYQKSLNVFK